MSRGFDIKHQLTWCTFEILTSPFCGYFFLSKEANTIFCLKNCDQYVVYIPSFCELNKEFLGEKIVSRNFFEIQLFFFQLLERGMYRFWTKTFRNLFVKLIPRSGDSGQLKNWRPFSLLDTDCKIFADVLANQLKSSLHHLLYPNQNAYLEGR